jgi:hypothetical protein
MDTEFWSIRGRNYIDGKKIHPSMKNEWHITGTAENVQAYLDAMESQGMNLDSNEIKRVMSRNY